MKRAFSTGSRPNLYLKLIPYWRKERRVYLHKTLFLYFPLQSAHKNFLRHLINHALDFQKTLLHHLNVLIPYKLQ